MKFSDHVNHTEQLYGVRAEDIHSWIDGLFDMERFGEYQRSGDREGYNPYAHREFRHCREALEDAFLEFNGKYPQDIIQKVFECHIKDDYQGYLPSREDFTYGTFAEKYHEDEELAAQERILSKAELVEYFKGRQYTKKTTSRLHASSGFYLRIVLPTVCALVLFILTLFILEIPVFHDAMIERKKEMIKELTTVAVGAVDYYIAQEQKGLLSREAAQQAAAAEIGRRSNARHEMTLFSDQDTALIFEDTDDERVKNYFLRLGQHVCAALNKAGYPYCSGGIMAANLQWNMPLADWKKQISQWVHFVSNESMVALHVFVDNACVYGDEKLAKVFQECVLETVSRTPGFLSLIANDALLYKVPLDIMGRIRPDKKGGTPAIPIKECLKPLEIFSRVYVLKNSISKTSTLGRLHRLLELGVVEESTCQDATYVFNYLWQLRFYNQLVLNDELKVVDDMLELSCLAEVERRNLKNVLALIPELQSKLNYDFLGGQGG